jgi:hypothetical protein
LHKCTPQQSVRRTGWVKLRSFVCVFVFVAEEFRMSEFAYGWQAKTIVWASLQKLVQLKFRNTNLRKAKALCSFRICSSQFYIHRRPLFLNLSLKWISRWNPHWNSIGLEWSVSLLPVWEILNSNLCPETCYPNYLLIFLIFSRKNFG